MPIKLQVPRNGWVSGWMRRRVCMLPLFPCNTPRPPPPFSDTCDGLDDALSPDLTPIQKALPVTNTHPTTPMYINGIAYTVCTLGFHCCATVCSNSGTSSLVLQQEHHLKRYLVTQSICQNVSKKIFWNNNKLYQRLV